MATGYWLLTLNLTNLYDQNHYSGCGVCFKILKEEVLQIRPDSPGPWSSPYPFLLSSSFSPNLQIYNCLPDN
jgi:hypothetical protein